MINPEKKLWQSVLITAIKDAFSSDKKNNSIYKKQIAIEAKDWLLNNNSNYFKVCSMADINPLSLREKVKDACAHKSQSAETGLESEVELNLLGIDSDIS